MAVKRRRFILVGGAAVIAATAPSAFRARGAGVSFAEIETQLGGGRLGVTAVDTATGARLSHRGGERFAMCSTFKWLLAAAVLATVDAGTGHLDDLVRYGPEDLLAVSPVTSAHVSQGGLTLRALCEAVVEVSDNAAANLLLKHLGGPAAVTSYLRQWGDPITRLDRTETALNSNLPGDPRDTTTPDAMVATMQSVLLGSALSAASLALLFLWLKNCATGRERLRAGMPPAWVVGDKTGTGDHGATNDIAIVWPPNRPPILIAAYLSGSTKSLTEQNGVHAKIASSIAAAFSMKIRR